MQKYDKYKDSGVQWLGEIPGHWSSVPMNKVISAIRTGLNPRVHFVLNTDDADGYYITIRELRGFDIVTDKSTDRINKQAVLRINERAKLKIGDVLISGTATIGRTALITKEPDNWGIKEGIYAITPKADIVDSKYLIYFFNSDVAKGFMDTVATGSTVRSVSMAKFYQMPLFLPPLLEQRTIVSFLDDKCEKIDEWIEKKQNEVELLGEMKQRAIADAVTRGIDSNAKMKPTNISWLPEVPEHWEMSKISSHFRQRSEKVSDKDYPALSVSKMGVTPQLDNVALSNAEGASRKLVKVGDYAVNSRSDRKGSCGVSKYEGSVSLITIVLEPFGVDGEYIHYLFRSTPWVEEFYRNGRGIVADLWTTNYQMMKGMYFPYPPLSEQRAIVSYITDRTAKIDKMIGNINREIENLKEYKQRLISDVVTGQIKVC